MKGLMLENELRSEIVRGVLAPKSRLRLDVLKLRYDVGFSPIREALFRLMGEGLVELEPNRGFRVTALSRDDLLDIALARSAVEGPALRLSIVRGDDRWEAQLVGAMHHYRLKADHAFDDEASLQAWESAHDAFHKALIGACGSARLLDMQRRLQDQHIRYRRLIVMPQLPVEPHVEEHEELVALALDRRADDAVARMERHLMITVDALASARFWEGGGDACRKT